jgi:hypothetical protein
MTFDIIGLAKLLLIGEGILVAGFTVVGAIAFWKTETGGATTFTSFFQRGDALRMITVGGIVIAATFLGLAKIVEGTAVVAILSGIAGYVLGGVEYSKNKANGSAGN